MTTIKGNRKQKVNVFSHPVCRKDCLALKRDRMCSRQIAKYVQPTNSLLFLIKEQSGAALDCEFEKKPSSRKKNYNTYYQKVKCRFCRRFISKVNIRRHQRLCRKNKEVDHDKYICEKCGVSYIRIECFKLHMKHCSGICKKDTISCTFKECTEIFQNKTSLMEHFIQYHDYVIQDPITKNFKTIAEFEQWKTKEEEEKCSYFVQDRKEKGSRVYFYCQRDKSLKQRKRASKLDPKIGRRVKIRKIKNDEVCIAMMQLFVSNDGSCSVKYFPTHSHSIDDIYDVLHQQQTRETNELIDQQIALNVPTREIVRNLNKHFSKKIGGYDKMNESQLITSKLVTLRKHKMKTALNYEKLLQLQYECAAIEKRDVKKDSDGKGMLTNSMKTHELENNNSIEESIEAKESKWRNEFEQSVPLYRLNREDYENHEETTIHITNPGKEWIVSLTGDPCAYLVHKVQDVCSEETCSIEYSSEWEKTLCSHIYTCTCANENDVCIHVQKVHSIELSNISAIECASSSQNEVVFVHKNVECILDSQHSNEKDKIVTDLKKSCQTLLALTDFMSLNVIDVACGNIDKLVKKCETLIHFTDLSDNSTTAHVSSG